MKILLALCVFLSCMSTVFSQDPTYSPNILPPSPEAAAFAKNVNIPVSYSSGTSQIGIPFCMVKSGGLEVPVSINYNASGIRVEEVPTWVGLGWNLSAGGQITRNVRGKPDESFKGYMNVLYNRTVRFVDSAHCRCTSPDVTTQDIELDLNTYHTLDLEPDQYSFSALGYSGDFYWNQDSAKFMLVPFQNIQITVVNAGFVLILPNGIKCHFGEVNSALEVLTSGTTASYLDGYSQAATDLGDANYVTSWMLTKLEDPVGKTVDLNYTTEYIINFNRGGERYGKTILEDWNVTSRQTFSKQYISKPVLESIKGENLNVYFKRSSTHRQDMPDYQDGSRSLDTVVIRTTNNIEVKSFYFRYGYFTSAPYSAGSMLNISAYGEEARKRLYLKSVTEKSGTDSLPPYEFTYNETELPSRLSTSQDYWGYYNGKSNDFGLMPRLPNQYFNPLFPNYDETYHILPGYGSYANTGGADRRIDPAFTQARMLTKVKYPTGGSSEYFYEQNDASTVYLNIYGGMEPPDMIEKSYTFSHLNNPLPSSAPYPLYFPGTFHVNIPATALKITPQLETCSINYDASCKLTVKLRSLPDSSLLATIQTTAVTSLPVAQGDYLVEVLVTGSSNDPPPNFNVNFQWGERLDSLSFPVGGVRIKKIITRDSVNNFVAQSFGYKDSLGRSSGIVDGCPTYYVHEVNASLQPVRRYAVSNSVLPLTANGKTVRYSFVSEYTDSARSGLRTDYYFTSGISDPRKFAKAKSAAPLVSWDWQNNLLKRKQVFEKLDNGNYRILSDEQHFYLPHKALYYTHGLYGAQIIPYSIASDWFLPDFTTTIAYAYPNGQPLTLQSSTQTFYNDWLLPSSSLTTNSKGQTLHSKTWYPTDYNNVSGYNIAALYGKNIWQLPIKQETSLNGKILSGNIIKYNEYGQPLENYAYENAALTDTVAHSRNVVLESNYYLRVSLFYDATANLKQINTDKAGPVTYIWDYQANGFTGGAMNQYPMAMAQNADSNSVAYTSFENIAQGNWSYSGTPLPNSAAVMGNKAYSLMNGSITKGGLSSSATYLVSYWSTSQQTVSNTAVVRIGQTNNNGWTYYIHKVTNPATGTITVSGSGTIDELRLYPEKAQMISYGYTDSWQLGSGCDANGKLIYYEYDAHGRLSLVRDVNKNILKKYCYNYAGQVENCGLGSTAQWQVVNSYCEQSSGINTGNKILVKQDTNPNSSTYGQTQTVTLANSCYVCTTGNCTGVDKKCIGNGCETGVKVYSGCVRVNRTTWTYYYYYQWSDASISQTYSETQSTPCSF